MIKQITSSVAMLTMVLTAAPVAFAGTISVSNDNNATITNSVTVSSNSGGNISSGARGARGAAGGDASGSGGSTNSAGNGGAGGDGGRGGSITSGNAVSTAVITSEVNSSETYIEDNDAEDEYNESLILSSRRGASMTSGYYENSEYAEGSEEENAEGSLSAWDNEIGNESDSSSGSASASSGGGSSATASDYDNDSSSAWNNSEGIEGSFSASQSAWGVETTETSAGFVTAEEHDNLDLSYTRTYVGDDDDISVSNSNDASVSSGVVVGANSGDNESYGGRGARGAAGGDVSGGGNNSAGTGGAGGNGGSGAAGGNIQTGLSDSLTEVATVSGRTITRVVRN